MAHALRMAREGADLIDVGGESSRPGAVRVDADEQIARTADVIRACRAALDDAGFAGVRLSIDTTRAAVAAAALDAGAALLNDISAGEDDPDLLTLAAARGCRWCSCTSGASPRPCRTIRATATWSPGSPTI